MKRTKRNEAKRNEFNETKRNKRNDTRRMEQNETNEKDTKRNKPVATVAVSFRSVRARFV